MGCGAGGGPPYSAVILILGLTEDPIVGGYIRGKLTLAGLDLSTDLGPWLDAVWAAYAEAPMDVLKKAAEEMVKAQARVRPQEARETWGLRPEHRAMAGTLGRGRGLESGAAGLGPSVGAKDATGDVEKWRRQMFDKQQARRRGR